MDLLHDSFPVQFRVVSDPDAPLPTLLTHSSPLPQYPIPSGKSHSTR